VLFFQKRYYFFSLFLAGKKLFLRFFLKYFIPFQERNAFSTGIKIQ